MAILVLVVAAIAGAKRLLDGRWKNEIAFAVAGCTWALVATIFSDNRALSIRAMVTVLSTSILFVAACATSARKRSGWLAAILAPAVINAIIMLLEAAGVWSPFGAHALHFETALLGNRNDTAVYLLGPAVAALVLSVITGSRWRYLHAAVSAILTAGLLATQTFTAIVAFGASAAAFLALTRHRMRLLVLAGLMVAVASSGALLLWSRHSLDQMTSRFFGKLSAIASGNLDIATTRRVGAYLTAWEMFKDDPLTGVGPDVFRYDYLPRRIEIEQKHPTRVWPSEAHENFGEVHNDHLQVLAESGLIGYLLFIGFGIYVASRSFSQSRDDGDEELHVLGRSLALPLVVAFFVVALGQFPIELAAPRYTFLLLAAICCAWTR